MQFATTDLPTGITTVEGVLAWCVQVLSAQQYQPLELSNQSGPVAPIFERVSRAPSGPNYSKPYLEFGGFIPLDNALYPTETIYLATVPFVATDTIPARFAAA